MRRTFRHPALSGIGPLLLEALWLFVVLRLATSAVAAYVAAQGPPGPCHFELANHGWNTLPELSTGWPGLALVGIWERWDACWYMKIAAHGYEPGVSSVAFFPLFPTLVGALGSLPLVSDPLAGMVVSAVAYLAAAVGLLRLVGRDFGLRVARRTMLYLSVFPAAFFLFAPFTEALFLALVVWTLERARARSWLPAALLAFATGLTRAQGLLLVIPLAWEALRAFRDQPPGERSWRMVAGSVIATAAPAGAFLAYGVLATALTGVSPYEAQANWQGTDLQPPWVVLATSLGWAIENVDALQAVNFGSWILFAALLVAGARRLPVTYSLYAWPALLLFASRLQPMPLTSTTRYLLVIFPAFVVLALAGRRRRVHEALLIVSTILLGLMAYLFLRGDFVA